MPGNGLAPVIPPVRTGERKPRARAAEPLAGLRPLPSLGLGRLPARRYPRPGWTSGEYRAKHSLRCRNNLPCTRVASQLRGRSSQRPADGTGYASTQVPHAPGQLAAMPAGPLEEGPQFLFLEHAEDLPQRVIEFVHHSLLKRDDRIVGNGDVFRQTFVQHFVMLQ